MSRNAIVTVVYLVLLFSASPTFATPPSVKNDEKIHDLVSKGERFFQTGNFEAAAQSWEKFLTRRNAEKYPDLYMATLSHLSHAYKAIGYHERLLPILNGAIDVLQEELKPGQNALLLSNMADVQLTLGNPVNAVENIENALDAAESSKNPKIMASVLNNAGNICAMDQNNFEAIAAYDECLYLLDFSEKNINNLKIKVMLNKAHTEYYSGHAEESIQTLEDGWDQMKDVPDGYAKAEICIGMGTLIAQISNTKELVDRSEEKEPLKETSKATLTEKSYHCLKKALEIGQEIENPRIISKANGYLAQLYERRKRYDDALDLTRKAIFLASQHNYPEIQYIWQWQLSRLLDQQGRMDQAIAACTEAIDTLNPIRMELFKGRRAQRDTFGEQVKPVYLHLADLYLRQADGLNGKKAKEKSLRSAMEVMEALKTAEIQNFYTDECVAAATMKGDMPLERTIPHSAVLYPISLNERLVLLLSLPDSLMHFSIPVDSRKLNDITEQFRRKIITRTSNRYLKYARMLYNWLIRPIESLLADKNIHTLVIAPDGALRQIPFAALEDGEQFLVEKYALGTIPAMRLTRFGKPDIQTARTLLGGLSEGVQEFSALPAVEEELRDVKTIMKAQSVLFNENFTITGLTREFKAVPYGILHMATHGYFGGTAKDSFLLTYEDQLNMDRLEKMVRLGQFRNQKVELLTLSACQTAMGNEQAVLGLAGVAVKAGVRSAIATLWFVDDEATSLAMREFYRQLKTTGISKAKALQNTQKKLISQRRFQHPIYWAPFLLIGNWM